MDVKTKRMKGAQLNRSGRWFAHAKVDGKTKYLGVFATEQEAHDAHVMATERRGNADTR